MLWGALWRLSVAAVLALVLSAPRAVAEEDLLHVGAGGFDIFRKGDAAAYQVEYRSGYRLLWRVRPYAGVMATTDSAVYAYGGLLAEVDLGWNVVAVPNLAVGYYDNGHGIDLGHHVEFRSGMELAYRFDMGARIGIGFYHISNAAISDENPGVEVLSVVFSYPISGPR